MKLDEIIHNKKDFLKFMGVLLFSVLIILIGWMVVGGSVRGFLNWLKGPIGEIPVWVIILMMILLRK